MSFIYYKFICEGIITLLDYVFINKMTFSKEEKNSTDGPKNKEEIDNAREKLKLVEDIFNSEYTKKYPGRKPLRLSLQKIRNMIINVLYIILTNYLGKS